ncbi:hypothetical protein [Salinivibrio sp. VYel1]|uniref:hypothetical protein n=1 Tax=Salinivibrio sp. VYel1 TaxID=2490490 RepID=UPI0018834DF0|nr:hypothetical protein [Salinivibrio sp. VYel1]
MVVALEQVLARVPVQVLVRALLVQGLEQVLGQLVLLVLLVLQLVVLALVRLLLVLRLPRQLA